MQNQGNCENACKRTKITIGSSSKPSCRQVDHRKRRSQQRSVVDRVGPLFKIFDIYFLLVSVFSREKENEIQYIT